MGHEVGRDHPLRQLFSGLVEQAFMAEMGMCDVAITDYLSGLLAEFVHVDRIYQLRKVDGDAIREVSRMQAEAYLGPETDETRRNWLIHKHIGDFTLFWTGVYPETLVKRRGADLMREYLLQGKRSYSIASELARPNTKPPAEVLRSLGEHFEFCVHGLHMVREGWERMNDRPWGTAGGN